ncbi:hypothetical protein ACFL59_07840 [Planctomycetota bacterium]
MAKWSELLVRERISPTHFESEEDWTAEDRKGVKDLEFVCGGVIRTKEKVKKVQDKVKKIRKGGTTTVKAIADLVLEELQEIKDDLKFAKSRRGKFVMFANDYAQTLYGTLRKDDSLAGVMVASHPEREEIVVTGSLGFSADLAKVAHMIEEQPPGVPVRYDVLVKPAPPG